MTNQHITLKDRIRYRFDRIMSRGQGALIGLLFLLTAASIGVEALLLSFYGDVPDEWQGGMFYWELLMRTIDPGTMAGDTGGWFFL